jgi:hypothetical protein
MEIVATSSGATIPTRPRKRLVSYRTLLIVAAALAVLCVTASSTNAAPSDTVAYTPWSAPVNLGPVVNSQVVPGSTGRETGPALSEDGLSLYFDSDRPGGSGGRDLWVSRRPTPGGAWGAPVNLGPTVNSTLEDSRPALSPDGHWMFFGSDRPGGLGGLDIWRSYRPDVHDDLGWQAPVNFGTPINTTVNDDAPSYFANPGGSPQLFFSSGPLRVNSGNATSR